MYSIPVNQVNSTNFNLSLIAFIAEMSLWTIAVYHKTIAFFKNVFVTAFAIVFAVLLFIPIVIAIPIIYGLAYCVVYTLLSFILRDILKQNRQTFDIKINQNLDNYADIRNRYDSLSLLLQGSAIKNILKIQTQQIPLLIRGIFSLCQKIIIAVVDNHKKTGQALDSLSPPTVQSSLFKPVSETVLWHNRNRQYQYKA